MKTVVVLLATMLVTLGLSTSAAGQNRWRIDRITSDRVYVMNKFDLVGSGGNPYVQPATSGRGWRNFTAGNQVNWNDLGPCDFAFDIYVCD